MGRELDGPSQYVKALRGGDMKLEYLLSDATRRCVHHGDVGAKVD